jgi:hypothetical protein
MIDWGGSYCCTSSPAYCQICLARDGSPFGEVNFDEWTGLYKEVLDAARRIIVPSSDVAARLRTNGLLQYNFLERPHPRMHGFISPTIERSSDGVRTVGFIGAIGPHKGSRLLRAMSIDAATRKLPLRFIVYGYTDFDNTDAFQNVSVTGKYDDHRFTETFLTDPCDIAFFASVWPETFCYALDHAFDNRIFPVSFAFGAPATRIAATGFGRTIDCDLMYSPAAINDLFLAMDLPNASEPITEEGRDWVSSAHYYDLPLFRK